MSILFDSQNFGSTDFTLLGMSQDVVKTRLNGSKLESCGKTIKSRVELL